MGSVDLISEEGLSVVIQIPAALRALTDNKTRIEVEARTVSEALQALVKKYPDLARYIFDEHQRIRSFINIFLNNKDIRTLNGLDTPLRDSDQLLILPAIAGGLPHNSYPR
jgi:adenylyltransferase/sulfurtransferase